MARGAVQRMAILLFALAGIAAGAGVVLAMPAGRASVAIVNFAFQPATVTIRAGDSVTWTNRDDTPHTATGDGGWFDTGLLMKGQSGNVTFTTPGTFGYYCAPHTFMRGTVVVLSASSETPDTLPATGDEVTREAPAILLGVLALIFLSGGGVLIVRQR